MTKKWNRPWLLSLSGALFLSMAWLVHPIFVFAGFAPLFLLEETISATGAKKTLRFLGWVYACMFVWNLSVTWWIVYSTFVGFAMAILLNSLFMSLPWCMYRLLKNATLQALPTYKSVIYRYSAWALAPLWISFEYLHMNWDLTWPWLNLGNSFAYAHTWVQWYEYTGTLGGTLWAIAGSILLYRWLKHMLEGNSNTGHYLLLQGMWALILVAPGIWSVVRYQTYHEKGRPVHALAVQPNVDPYTQKFEGSAEFIPYSKQLQNLIDLTIKGVTDSTVFVCWPETSLPAGYDEDLLEDQSDIRLLRALIDSLPHTSLITGSDTYKIYMSEFDKTPSSRISRAGNYYYDYFNTALYVESKRRARIYHKSKLTPGVEKLPFYDVFPAMNSLAIDLGGISGTLGTQTDRTVFTNKNQQSIAPVICYESIFGEFVREFALNGAQCIGIITNDGWWSYSPGHRQHLHYAQLRAIETRRSIVRAANTGISAFVNQRGDIVSTLEYGSQGVLGGMVHLHDYKTFYTLYGDYLGKGSVLYVLVLMSLYLWYLTAYRFSKFFQKK